MPTNTGSDTNYKLTIPLLTEAADIQSALKLLAYGSVDDPATDTEIDDNATAGNPGIAYYLKYLTENYAPLLNPVFIDSILFEGSTANAYETKLSVVDPTADRTITFPDATTTVVGTDVTQTLTNKTLTSPTINSGTVNSLTALSVRDTSAAYDITIAATSSTTLTAGRTLTLNLDNANRTLRLGANLSVLTNAVTLTGATGGSSVTIPATGTLATLTGSETLTNKTLTTPIISTISNTGTLTLPTSTDTLVGRATTDTLTNKTLTSPVISTISNTGTLTVPTSTDTLVGRATTDTLTNKSISGSTNTLSNIPNSATTATNLNTASAIVARDASGNFTAGTITATLSGNASSATNLAGGVAGTIAYQTGSGTTDFVTTSGAITGYVLKYNSGASPTWVDPAGIATVDNALNSENVGVTNDTTNVSAKYIAWVDANTGNNPVKVTSTKLTFTPSTGNLVATKFNNLTLTSATTGFTIAGGTTSKTLTISNTLTLAGTDSSTLNIGTGGTLGTAAFTASGDYQPIKTNLTSIGNLANAAGYLYNNGTGTFSYATPGDINTTYTQSAVTTTGGALLRLTGSNSTTDDVKFAGSGATTVSYTDASTITISSTDNNTTYTFASGTTNGAFSVTPSGSTAQSVSIYGLGTAAYKNIPATGNASATEIVYGSDTRLSDSRTPTSHTHGNILNGGTMTTSVTATSPVKVLITDSTNNIGLLTTTGASATTFLRGDGTWVTPSYPTAVTIAGTATAPAIGLTLSTGSGSVTATAATIPVANGTTTAGIVSTTTQTIGGDKTFTGTTLLSGNTTVSGTLTANGNISTTTSTALSISTGTPASATASGAVTLKTGNATSAASGAISILSGTTTTSGASGSVHINVGGAAGTTGSINIGNANVSNTGVPSAINIGAASGTPIDITGTVTHNGPVTIDSQDFIVSGLGATTNVQNLTISSGVFEYSGASTTSGSTTLTNTPGTTSQYTGAPSQYISVLQSFASTAAGNVGTEYRASTASSRTYLVTFSAAGALQGSISTLSGATAFTTSSDYRMKENVVPMNNALSRLALLKPSRFNFIEHPEQTVDGFLAHEVQEVIPEAVVGEKDELNEDGSPAYQGIDQAKMVPLLTAALQEAVAKIEELTARVEALEA